MSMAKLLKEVNEKREVEYPGALARAQRHLDRSDSRDKRYSDTLFREYRMDDEDYNNLLHAQHGRCAICRTDEPKTKHGRLLVDHNHTTGKIRGLLCQRCNVALGVFGDYIEGIYSVLGYLLNSEGYDTLMDWAEELEQGVNVHVVNYPDRDNYVLRWCEKDTGRVRTRSSGTQVLSLAQHKARLLGSELSADARCRLVRAV